MAVAPDAGSDPAKAAINRVSRDVSGDGDGDAYAYGDGDGITK